MKSISALIAVAITFAITIGTALSMDKVSEFTAPDGSNVIIYDDEYGVPHVLAESEVGAYYAQGYVSARDRLAQMMENMLIGEGRLSEIYGLQYLEFDHSQRLTGYSDAEKMEIYQNLPADLRDAMAAYVAGVNARIAEVRADPQNLTPHEIGSMGGVIPDWTIINTVSVAVYYARVFGSFGGQELERLYEFETNGEDWFEANRPLFNENAFPTIPESEIGAIPAVDYDRSDIEVPLEETKEYIEKREALRDFVLERGIPYKLGSFAVVAGPSKTDSPDALLLGCPQMGAPQSNRPNVIYEIELKCPEFHVGGMAIAGVPSVLIGRTPNFAWTLTSGGSDNNDVFLETFDEEYANYYYDGEWLAPEYRDETFYIAGDEPQTFSMFRSVHGPIFYIYQSEPKAGSVSMSFWKKELGMFEMSTEIAKAKDIEEFEQALRLNPMSFNVFYADTDGEIGFWHIGLVNDRTDGIDPRFPHSGEGDEEIAGYLAFENMPQLVNPQQDYYVNWNNIPVKGWDSGDECMWSAFDAPDSPINTWSNTAVIIEKYIGPISGLTLDQVKNTPREIGSHGTYQQVLRFGETVEDYNIVPPGQSGFINLDGDPDEHFSDQWSLHTSWNFKEMRFDEFPATSAPGKKRFSPKCSPNPASGELRFEFELDEYDLCTLQILDSKGSIVRTVFESKIRGGRFEETIDISDLSSGAYFIRLSTSSAIFSEKFVVRR